jgi:hypothetical protein
MTRIREDRLGILAIPVPYDRQPLAGLDQVGADQKSGDEAVQLLKQHCILAQREELVFKLLGVPA